MRDEKKLWVQVFLRRGEKGSCQKITAKKRNWKEIKDEGLM